MNQKNAHNKLHEIPHAIKLHLSHETTDYGDKIFTQTIKSYPYAIATRNDEGFITSPSQLNDKTVCIVKDSTVSEKIKNTYPKINFIEVTNTQTALERLSRGKVFAVIDVLPSLTHIIKSNSLSNIKISGTTPFKYDLRFMTNENESTLISILNKIIDNLTKKR